MLSLLSNAQTRQSEDFQKKERQARHPHLLRIGDIVKIVHDQWDQGNRWKEIQKYPIGQTGRIVGFAIQSVCRFKRHAKVAPGIYLNPAWPLVEVQKNVHSICADCISLSSDIWQERYTHSARSIPDSGKLYGARVGDLPDTEIWEGDVVELRPEMKIEQPEDLPLGTIPDHPSGLIACWMNFTRPGDVHESLETEPHVRVSDRLLCIEGSDGFPMSSLRRIQHGNVWRRAHDQPLIFHDLAEEAIFFYTIGEATDVKSGRSEGGWDKQSGLQAIRAGRGHGLWRNRTPERISYNLVKYDDPFLGKRIARATVQEGFRIPSPFNLD